MKVPWVAFSACLFYYGLRVLSLTAEECNPDVPFNSRTLLRSRRNRDTDNFIRHEIKEGFPYYVSIRQSLYGEHHCGGVLIAADWVLTSAWCMDKEFHGRKVVNASVHIGSYTQKIKKKKHSKAHRLKPEHINISAVHVHKKYSNGTRGTRPYDIRYDIALLQLNQSSAYQSVGLPLDGIEACCEDMELWSVGFGRTTIGGPYALIREAARFPFLPYDECYDYFKKQGNNEYFTGGKNMSEDFTVCVGNLNNQCLLDIGAPLVAKGTGKKRDILVGFNTHATGECSYKDSYNFAFINGYLDWILSIDGVMKSISEASSNWRISKEPGAVFPKTVTSIRVDIEDFPYAVTITTKSSQAHECGGVLIAPQYVLTTASCVIDLAAESVIESLTITIGSSKLLPGSAGSHEVMEQDTSSVIRRQKNGVYKNDVAIIRLEKESKFQPVKLPYNSKMCKVCSCTKECCIAKHCCEENTTLLMPGWGSSTPNQLFSRHLTAAKMTFLSRRKCWKQTSFTSYPIASFCAGDKVTQGALCNGDIGNGIIFPSENYDILIGIATTEIDKECSVGIGQFYRIDYLRKWITRTITEE